MNEATLSSHWLELYASTLHDWHYEATDESISYDVFSRRLGIVESMFDADGLYWEGRADVHPNLLVEMKTTLNKQQLRDRFILAWTLIRHSHMLLACTSAYPKVSLDTEKPQHWNDKHFYYRRPKTTEAAIAEARQHIVFLEDEYPSINVANFQLHLMNTARVVNPEMSMSKLFVFPPVTNKRGNLEQRFMMVVAHEVTDGLAIFRVGNHMIDILNEDGRGLRNQLQKLLARDGRKLVSRLPPAQESLYPRRAETRARSNWHWAITRVLRHVRRPTPAAFPNPLRRDTPLQYARAFPPSYSKVLDYSRTPPLNTAPFSTDLSLRAVQNLARMCKEAGITVGSGCFTLVAMVMMHFEELHNPDIPLNERRPFVGGFPVNPRPFLSEIASGGEGSCMLAFSDGVVLPFLPQDLDFKGRFRVLGRLAHRQLGQYQKRKRTTAEELHLGSRSPGQLVPQMYLYTMERVERMVEEGDHRRKVNYNIYGAYPPAPYPGQGTCAISSVGDTSSIVRVGKYDVNKKTEKDLVVDLRTLGSSVRPREGEFLVGIAGTKTSLGVSVNCDTNVLDPEKMAEWKHMISSILDKDFFEDVGEAPSNRTSQFAWKL